MKLPPNFHVFPLDSTQAYFFKDEDVFKLPSGEAKVWTETVTPSVKIKNKTYHGLKTKMLWMVDCAQYKLKLIEIFYYSYDDKILQDIHSESNEYKDVMPETIGSRMTDAICKIINK